MQRGPGRVLHRGRVAVVSRNPWIAWKGRQNPSYFSRQQVITESVIAPCITANIRAVRFRPIGFWSR